MDDSSIYDGSWVNIAVPIAILLSRREEASVMSLLNNDNSNLDLLYAGGLAEGIPNGRQLVLNDLIKLTTSDPVTEVDKLVRERFGRFLVLRDEGGGHLVDFLDDFHTMRLVTCYGGVTDGEWIERSG